MVYNNYMNTNTTPTYQSVQERVFVNDAIVVAPPTGRTSGFGGRVYQCLSVNPNKVPCNNRGTTDSGSFVRVGGDTYCGSCGKGFNRWVRDAAV